MTLKWIYTAIVSIYCWMDIYCYWSKDICCFKKKITHYWQKKSKIVFSPSI